MANVLVVGGAGYVGSVTCTWLLDAGHRVWVLDDLSTGHSELVFGSGFTCGQAGDVQLVTELLSQQKFDCVMHFAAKSLVGESVQKPQEYFENNVTQTQTLLGLLLQFGVRNFIFSSTCAIFGDPGESRVHEHLPMAPLNPYGQTKLEVERHLDFLGREKGLRSIALRYFNAAGADPQLRAGEWHEPESHLIPKVLKAAAQETPIEVYGTDYPTPDGTCVRDYVDVWSLAESHGLAMERLLRLPKDDSGIFEAYNLGSESGYSVRQVIQACEEVSSKKIQVIYRPRRAGDPPRLVADSSLAKKVLGYGKSQRNIKDMISTAWAWEKKRSSSLKKAVFLDRDGTINDDPGYLSHPDQMNLLPKVGEALSQLKAAGYLLVVVSNQSGVSRGLIDIEMMPQIHKKLDQLLAPWGVAIDRYELCFHCPDEQCECRKPKPKLILDAAKILNIDVSRSFMIGDKVSDIDAGRSASCKGSILVRTGDGKHSEKQLEKSQTSFVVVDSLFDAAQWVLSQK
jgi:UDP-glucose-4-epimerase GalE